MDYDSVRFKIVTSPGDNRDPPQILYRGRWGLEADLAPVAMGQTNQVLVPRSILTWR